MPTKKRNSSNNNKKKKKNNNNNNKNHQNPKSKATLKKKRHQGTLFGDNKRAVTFFPQDGGLYGEYKLAVQSIHAQLGALVPSKLLLNSDKVHALVDAVDYLCARNNKSDDDEETNKPQVAVPESLIQDLVKAIFIRNQATAGFKKKRDHVSKNDSNDVCTQTYLLDVLEYCLHTLLSINSNKEQAKDDDHNAKNQRTRNDARKQDMMDRLRSLSLSAQESSDGYSWMGALPGAGSRTASLSFLRPPRRLGKFPRPTPLPQLSLLSISKDLTTGTDRFQASIFLHAMDRMLGAVQYHYGTFVKEKCDDCHKSNSSSKDLLLLEVMGAATSTVNMSILHIQQLENVLVKENPHLSSLYRILGCVLFGEVIDTMWDICRKFEPKTKLTRELLTGLVGDVIECAFRSDIDPRHDLSRLLDAFDAKHAPFVPSSVPEWKRILNLLHMRAKVETHSLHKLQQSDFLTNQLKQFGLQPHTWFQGMVHMGGKRNILNTLCLLQWMGSIFVKHHGVPKLAPQLGFFGPRIMLHDPNERIDKMHSDMDDLLMTEILPELMAACQGGIFSCYTFPLEDHIFPLFMTLKRYMVDYSQAVPTALVVGVHALLMSLYELQGNDRLQIIAQQAKAAYQRYGDQLVAMSRSPRFQGQQAWSGTFGQLQDMMLLPQCVGSAVSPRSEQLAFWNPYCAGTFLSFLTFQLSLDGGAQLIDSYAQIRLVLHVYHGLRECRLIERGIPVLDTLDHHLENCKAVWDGPKPDRGGYFRRFCIAFGFPANIAQQLDDETHRAVLKGANLRCSEIETRGGDLNSRKLPKIKPGELSESYQLACLHDFKKKATDDRIRHCDRVVCTRRAMAQERELMCLNLIRLGGILHDFVGVLGDAMLQEPSNPQESVVPELTTGRRRRRPGGLVEPQSSSSSKQRKALCTESRERSMAVYCVARMVLGHLDASKQPSIACHTASQCFVSFFGNLDPSLFKLWSTPTDGA